MKFGLLEYTTNNIGDEIQSIAAKQYLPRVDTYLDRDHLHKVENDEKIRLIMNGWFSHKPTNWPPSPNIEPLFVSFHISSKAEDEYTSPKSIEYLSNYEPIGCRDLHTRNLLLENGINAYFSGCLTMTLSNDYSDQNSGDIYFVDVEKGIREKAPRYIREKAEHLTHNYTESPRVSVANKLKFLLGDSIEYANKIGVNAMYNSIWDIIQNSKSTREVSKEEKFKDANKKLDKYAQAELVITRRLHAALPSIAFNTPVILVHDDPNDRRFGGLDEYINIYTPEEFINLSSSDMLLNVSNPNDVKGIAADLQKEVKAFINGA